MNNALSGLATVQQLYLMQVELWNLLDRDLSNADTRKEIRSRVREFGSLLREADPRYMGGEDVYASLVTVQKQVSDKLGSAGVRSRAAGRSKAPAKKDLKVRKVLKVRKATKKKRK